MIITQTTNTHLRQNLDGTGRGGKHIHFQELHFVHDSAAAAEWGVLRCWHLAPGTQTAAAPASAGWGGVGVLEWRWSPACSRPVLLDKTAAYAAPAHTSATSAQDTGYRVPDCFNAS